MLPIHYFPDWRDRVVYSPDGPQPQILMANEQVKVILGGLEAGQSIPNHPEAAAVYHFLEGRGRMIVDGQANAVGPGATIIMPAGSVRGVEADTRLAFLAVRLA